jgi:homospermidine synthase
MLRDKIENYAERMSALEEEAKDILKELFTDDRVKDVLLTLNDENYDDFIELLIKAVSRRGILKEVVDMSTDYAEAVVGQR